MSVDKLGELGSGMALQSVSRDDQLSGRDRETKDISQMVALDATRESREMEAGSKEKMVKTASKASVFIKQAITFVKAFFATWSMSFAKSHASKGFGERDVQVFRGEQLYKKVVAASVGRKNAERALSQAAKDKGEIQNESTASLGKTKASLGKSERAFSKADANFKNAEAALKGSISSLLEYECHHGNTVANLSERLEKDLGVYAGVSPGLASEVLAEFPALRVAKMEEKIQGMQNLGKIAKFEATKLEELLLKYETVDLDAGVSVNLGEVDRDNVSSVALRDGIIAFKKNIADKVREFKLALNKEEISKVQAQALVAVSPRLVKRLPEISQSFDEDCKGIGNSIEDTLILSSSQAKAASVISVKNILNGYTTQTGEVVPGYRASKAELLAAKETAWKTFVGEKKTLDDKKAIQDRSMESRLKGANDENEVNRKLITSAASTDKSLGSSVSKELAKEEARYAKAVKDLEKEDRDNLRTYDVGLKEAKNTRDKELARCDRGLADAKSKMKEAIAANATKLRHGLARAKTVHDKAVAELDALKTQGKANLQSLQGLLTGHKGSLIADKIANMKSVIDVEEVSQRSSDQLSDREKNLSEKVESLSKKVEILAKQVASKVGKKPIFVKVVENFSKTRQLQTEDRLAKFQEVRELDQLEKKQANVGKKYSAEKKRAELQEKEARRVDLLLDSITTKETKANIAINRKLAQSFMKKKTAESRRKEVLGRSEALETKRVKALKSKIDRMRVDAVKRRQDRLDDIVLKQEKAAAKRLTVINRKEMLKEKEQAAFISEVRAFVKQYNDALTHASYMVYGLKKPKTYDEAVRLLENVSQYEDWIQKKGLELPFVPVLS